MQKGKRKVKDRKGEEILIQWARETRDFFKILYDSPESKS
jgi:hypothetical protein